MTETTELIRAYVERLEARDWDGFAAVLHPDVVYRMPQSREVVRGRDAYLRWNQEYPDVWHLRLAEVYGDPTGGAARLDVDDSRESGPITALVFFRVADGQVREVTDWWPEPFDPPAGRSHLAEPQ
jgi:ketosteroid isomerase-like protein